MSDAEIVDVVLAAAARRSFSKGLAERTGRAADHRDHAQRWPDGEFQYERVVAIADAISYGTARRTLKGRSAASRPNPNLSVMVA
jgi:hypothetical protein